MSDDEMLWEDPPPRIREPWLDSFVSRLQEHPGKWAKVISPNGRITHGSALIGRLKSKGCEVRSTHRGAPTGLHLMWARWPDG